MGPCHHIIGTAIDVKSDEGVLVPKRCSPTDGTPNQENPGQPCSCRDTQNVTTTSYPSLPL